MKKAPPMKKVGATPPAKPAGKPPAPMRGRGRGGGRVPMKAAAEAKPAAVLPGPLAAGGLLGAALGLPPLGGRPQPVVEAADAAQRPSQEPCHPLSGVRLELPHIWQAVAVGFLRLEVLCLTLEVAPCSMACAVQVRAW